MKKIILTLFTSIAFAAISSAQTGNFTNLLVQDDDAEIRIKSNQTNQVPSGSIVFDESTGDNHFSIVYDGIAENSGGKLRFAGYEGDFMTITREGKVGIGTTDPNYPLSVRNDDGVSNAIHQLASFSRLTSGAGNAGLNISYEANGSATTRTLLYFPGGNGATFQVYNQGVLDVLHLSPSGNVGVGTADTDDYKFAVKGSIKAEEIVVETTWSDFVFDDEYNLRSLEEVEFHIEEHGHLPDVPSAAIVVSEGLSLGEAQKIMMQKIEELTLYMIEKDKQVAALQARVAELESN